jgi:phospholipid N-methyltransferase
MYYGDKQTSLVNLSRALRYNEWSIYGFKADKSDSMTDYFDPASWDGIAVKNGYILVIDNYSNGTIGGDIVKTTYDHKIGQKIQKLQALLDCPSASVGEKTNAEQMISKLSEKTHNETTIPSILPRIEYQKNPGTSKWHIEKNGDIIAKGTGVFAFSDVNTWRDEDLIFEKLENNHNKYTWNANDSQEEWTKSYKHIVEQRVKTNATLDKFFKLINKWESLVALTLGDGEEEKLVKQVQIKKTVHLILEPSDTPTDYCRCGKGWTRFAGLEKGLIYKIDSQNQSVRKLTSKWIKFSNGEQQSTYKAEPNKSTKSRTLSWSIDDVAKGDVEYVKLVERIEEHEEIVWVKPKIKTVKTPAPKKSEVKKTEPKISKLTTFSEFNAFTTRIHNGTAITLHEIHAQFDAFMARYDVIKAEVSGLKKEEILNLGGAYFKALKKNEKKDFVVNSLLNDLTFSFIPSEMHSWQPHKETFEEATYRQLNDFTQEKLDKYIQQRLVKIEAMKAEQLALEKSLANPETYDDFKEYLKYKAWNTLSKEQQIAADEVISQKSLEIAKKEKTTTVEVNAEGVEFELAQTVHAKKNIDLFVVKMLIRVDREQYQTLLSAAKALGGWYSKFTRNGAIPGFQFEKIENAHEFMALQGVKCDITSTKENKSPHEALIEKATKLRKDGQAKLDQKRLTNTHRRVSIATSVESTARAMINTANQMEILASKIEAGEVKYLNKINSVTAISQLRGLLRNARFKAARAIDDERSFEKRFSEISNEEAIFHAVFPYPRLHSDILKGLLDESSSRSGARILKVLKKHKEPIFVINKRLIADFEDMLSRIPNVKDNYHAKIAQDNLNDYKRMVRLGISSIHLLRASLRELITLNFVEVKVDPIVIAERDLIDSNIDGFFPTPKDLVESMLDKAGIEEGMTVLEPSAGKGDIADAISELGFSTDVIEYQHRLKKILSLKGHTHIADDFLEFSDKTYDRIVMNPPFEKYQDIEHVQHAYARLNNGGRLVAIMSASGFNNQDKKATAFRSWLDELGADYVKNSEGAFLSAFRSTGVSTYTVVIDKEIVHASQTLDKELEITKLAKLEVETEAFRPFAHNSKAMQLIESCSVNDETTDLMRLYTSILDKARLELSNTIIDNSLDLKRQAEITVAGGNLFDMMIA